MKDIRKYEGNRNKDRGKETKGKKKRQNINLKHKRHKNVLGTKMRMFPFHTSKIKKKINGKENSRFPGWLAWHTLKIIGWCNTHLLGKRNALHYLFFFSFLSC